MILALRVPVHPQIIVNNVEYVKEPQSIVKTLLLPWGLGPVVIFLDIK